MASLFYPAGGDRHHAHLPAEHPQCMHGAERLQATGGNFSGVLSRVERSYRRPRYDGIEPNALPACFQCLGQGQLGKRVD